jgi:hypothetical protein
MPRRLSAGGLVEFVVEVLKPITSVGVQWKWRITQMTTECEHMLMELEEKVGKWRSAGDAVQNPMASQREKSDFKMIEEDYLALQRLDILEILISPRLPVERMIERFVAVYPLC